MSRSPVDELTSYHPLIYTAGGGKGYLNSSISFNSRTVPITGVRDEVWYRVLIIIKELYGLLRRSF